PDEKRVVFGRSAIERAHPKSYGSRGEHLPEQGPGLSLDLDDGARRAEPLVLEPERNRATARGNLDDARPIDDEPDVPAPKRVALGGRELGEKEVGAGGDGHQLVNRSRPTEPAANGGERLARRRDALTSAGVIAASGDRAEQDGRSQTASDRESRIHRVDPLFTGRRASSRAGRS